MYSLFHILIVVFGFPIIYYFYAGRKNINEIFDLHYKILEYILCNETSKSKKSKFN